jgi:hypothetical protein
MISMQQVSRAVWLLKNANYSLWYATQGAAAQHSQKIYNDLSTPKIGDLVMEVGTHLRGKYKPEEGIGTLIWHGSAPWYKTEEEAIAAGFDPDDGPLPERLVWDIRLDFGDGSIQRWENARFIKIKTDL